MASLTEKEIVTARLPRSLMDEVRRIAASEAESHAHVIRRLLRTAIAIEQQQAER